ncbi:hypothetical protein Bca101_086461 [Brassica carinata]
MGETLRCLDSLCFQDEADMVLASRLEDTPEMIDMVPSEDRLEVAEDSTTGTQTD